MSNLVCRNKISVWSQTRALALFKSREAEKKSKRNPPPPPPQKNNGQKPTKQNQQKPKYIVPGETAESALLFVPSESIFAEIHHHHQPIVDFANSRRVGIVSPTTLMAVLTAVRGVLKDAAVRQRSDEVMGELAALLADVDRVVKRAGTVERHFDRAREELRLLGISTDKVRRRGVRLRALEDGESLEEGSVEGVKTKSTKKTTATATATKIAASAATTPPTPPPPNSETNSDDEIFLGLIEEKTDQTQQLVAATN